MQEIDPPESPLNKNLDHQKDRDLIQRLVKLTEIMKTATEYPSRSWISITIMNIYNDHEFKIPNLWSWTLNDLGKSLWSWIMIMIPARSLRISMIKINEWILYDLKGSLWINDSPRIVLGSWSLCLIIKIRLDRARIMTIIHDQRDFLRSLKVQDRDSWSLFEEILDNDHDHFF